MSRLLELPSIMPRLNIDFSSSQAIDPRVVISRASDGFTRKASGRLSRVNAGIPRLGAEALSGTGNGLLIEETRSNIVLNSANFEKNWLHIGLSNELSDDCPIEGYKSVLFTQTDELSEHTVRTNVAVAFEKAKTYVWSHYVKALDDVTIFRSRTSSTILGSWTAYDFNLRTGKMSRVEGSTSMKAFMYPAGNGWWRVGIIFKPIDDVTTREIRFFLQGERAYTHQGSTANKMLVFGAQLEVGERPTSYIPTNDTAVTRASDLVKIPSGLIDSSGTLLIKYAFAGWKYTNNPGDGEFNLSTQLGSGAPVNDSVLRVVQYPRALTPREIALITMQ